MTTVLSLVNRVRRQLDSGHRNEYNQLNGALNNSTTSVVLEFEPNANVEVGDVINIDFELMRVVAYNSGTKTATVVRGYLDSTAAAHADDAEVMINPRFSMLDAYTALVDEINSWGPQLYRVAADEFTVAAGTDVLEIPASWASMYGLVGVYRRWDDDAQEAPYAWPQLGIRLVRATTDWSLGAPNSGIMIRFVDAVAAGTVLVVVALPFSAAAATSTSDLETDLFVPREYHDFLALGAKLRLIQDGEWGRLSRDQQDDSRRSEETPVGSAVSSLNFGFATYRNRREEETNKLYARHPIRWR